MPVATSRRPHKYGAKATEVDGIRFASQKEARRYQELRLLEKARRAWGIGLQCRFSLTVAGVEIGSYLADFVYYEVDDRGTSRQVVEDVKGFKTPLYRWKKKHFEAQYGVTIREV